MASGHTHEVRPEFVPMTPGISLIRETQDMRQPESRNLIIYHKNQTFFFLYNQTTIDINPIAKTIVPGTD